MRGQAHTLEGVAAALLVVATVAFTIQATAVTPLTASTASQHIETQHERAASGLLETERANGNLSRTLRYWNGTGASFANASANGYYVGEPPNASFLLAVEETFGDRAVAYNVNAYYVDANGDRRTRRVVHHGDPSADAVAATRLVTLYDNQSITERNGTRFEPTAKTLADVDDATGERYFAPNAPGHAYAVVEVEVVLWRM
ncbi:hypothetical protein ABSL23_09080 [Halobacterium sp. NMX12-1]|uniref:Flagellin n=1 Tax=Halobacterium sp. NMX12-1 TaxID=3166650 RepID=A0AAU8C9C4_9EURY